MGWECRIFPAFFICAFLSTFHLFIYLFLLYSLLKIPAFYCLSTQSMGVFMVLLQQPLIHNKVHLILSYGRTTLRYSTLRKMGCILGGAFYCVFLLFYVSFIFHVLSLITLSRI